MKLPLAKQGTVTDENRFEKGLDVQIGLYGDRIRSARANAPKDAAHIQDDLASFCFGDTYTREGLDVQQREIITFAAIATLGGAEPQRKGHILRKGSRKTFSSLLYANSMIPEKPTFRFRRRSAFCIASLEFHRISCYTTPSGKT